MSDLAPSPVAVDGDALEEILEGFHDIPTIPEVLVRIWQIVDDPKSSASDLEEVVRLEPPLAAKVLRLANSPYFGGRGRIADVRMAITTLGFETLRNLAVCLSVASGLAGRQPTESRLDTRQLWQHCVATGVVARALAKERGLDRPDEAFTAGLLHDIGKFVIGMGRPDAYGEVARLVVDEGLDPRAAEVAVLGFDHAIVGMAFAARWNFPPRLQAVLCHHHDTGRDDLDDVFHAVVLANRITYALDDYAIIPGCPGHGPDDAHFEAFKMEPAWLDEHSDELRSEIDEAHEFMNLV